jgi:hypothetical protein
VAGVKFLQWVGDNPTAWFLLLLSAFMGAALTIGWACSPTIPAPRITPQTVCCPVEVDEP